MNLYLDIDGTIITKQGQEANHLEEFLIYATTNYDCYWLSTHVQGDATDALRYLESVVSEKSMILLKQFKPTSWSNLKTEAIDFTQPFVWLDDCVFTPEKVILKNRGVLDSLIEIDLKNNPDQLLTLIKKI
ncbi:MAG: hypothetical protein COX77_00655 [Candidatus Komeilibacteria bacterium CG_4_10_14_0_2_um_filter_37_10]|uniref:FCP1 homology domain-containing protein n=1 Tax=Candidatus Komeilibacteria bacterium CG_4_10_14_0_2_um_filter_37_10 TaxID=1974470 RepID=A0A2M7VGD6_9BACT|nr:MAG: hypothetical protein COX77_00655 [Candidatus Komeilibacteria bacterium CG_4_10_14_0_2_um_filter_37_10]PJA94106.1 MAG: hypothetical protein CO133_00665 [Candidatus Komeilibacteria bacterium CG_4_9_14_3_um_filter_37_5]